jgi:hypothetical protein
MKLTSNYSSFGVELYLDHFKKKLLTINFRCIIKKNILESINIVFFTVFTFIYNTIFNHIGGFVNDRCCYAKESIFPQYFANINPIN